MSSQLVGAYILCIRSIKWNVAASAGKGGPIYKLLDLFFYLVGNGPL
jgi:hypothetical protein